jgi:(1->4)-alpha-D-glucan 1-alpha-D-glucosylmutase
MTTVSFGNTPDAKPLAVRAAKAHAFFQERQRLWPHALSATSTHDTKRSEDVRARLNVLSELPRHWQAAVGRWKRMNDRHRIALDSGDAPSRNDEYHLYQTVVGAWPLGTPSAAEHANLVRRVGQFTGCNVERPFQGQIAKSPIFPGLRPGLTESTFQAEKSFTALPERA